MLVVSVELFLRLRVHLFYLLQIRNFDVQLLLPLKQLCQVCKATQQSVSLGFTLCRSLVLWLALCELIVQRNLFDDVDEFVDFDSGVGIKSSDNLLHKVEAA